MRAATGSALEVEATVAANAIARGRLYSPVLTDRSEQPRWWGVAGHFYTVYLISVAVGLDPEMAFRSAIFTQMPDQVDELDATSAGTRPYMAALGAAGNSMATGLGPGAGLGPQPFAPQLPSSDDIAVQRGLHALTGNSAKHERDTRRSRLNNLQVGDLEFGLALHAFGDSYAHTTIDDEGILYRAPFGHAVEAVKWRNGWFRDPHAPDSIFQRPALYKEYAQALFDILSKGRKAPTTIYPKINEILSQITKFPEERAQCEMIKMAIAGYGGSLRGYQPELEALSQWSEFRKRHFWIRTSAKDEAVILARRWA